MVKVLWTRHLKNYIETLNDIIKKVKLNMNKYDAWETDGK